MNSRISSAQRNPKIGNADATNSDNGLLVMTGGLMIGLPDSEVIQGTIKSVKEHNLSHEVLCHQEMKKRFPLFHVSADERGQSEFTFKLFIKRRVTSVYSTYYSNIISTEYMDMIRMLAALRCSSCSYRID